MFFKVINVLTFVGVLLLAVLYLGGSADVGANTAEYNVKEFLNTVTFSGATSYTGAVTIGSGGTAINKYKCYTDATFDPGSVSSSTAAATLAFLTPSVTAGDIIVASLNSVTSTQLWGLDAKVTAGSGTATATTTLYLIGREAAAVNLSTTTAKVCIFN